MSFPKALKGDPKIIFFTDFDGTITLDDTNDYMSDNLGVGAQRRRQLNIDCLEGRATFREIFQELTGNIDVPYPECIRLLVENIRLDPHFNTFFQWARSQGVPVVVLSSGLTEIIRTLLEKLVGREEAREIEIICNEMVERPGMTKDQRGGWTIKFHDDSDFGHDKSLTIRPYAEHFEQYPPGKNRPVMLYAGDGVSDLSAARETDLLFAKKGRDLVTYCEREGLPFTVFEDWSSILEITKDIYEGRKSIGKVAKEGLEEAKADVA